MNKKTQEIPLYDLASFRHVHREETASVFGYNNLGKSKHIPGFELYSSEGLIPSVGPLKSAFYRISITVKGTLDMKIGLEEYKHQPGTVSVTYPNQLFAKSNISPDAFGYYILFSDSFLNTLIPAIRIPEEFPFFDISATPVFCLKEAAMQNLVQLVSKIDTELHLEDTGRVKAIQLYLYLLLLEVKRNYEKEGLHEGTGSNESYAIVSTFRKLVGKYYLEKRQVSDYANMLSISANHLNRLVKASTGKTASDTIKEMLLLEAKSLLKYTTQSIGEIGYSLDFSDPTTFNRFFKRATGLTPLEFRQMP